MFTRVQSAVKLWQLILPNPERGLQKWQLDLALYMLYWKMDVAACSDLLFIGTHFSSVHNFFHID